MPRHRHAQAYLALVIEGRYREANGAGRRELHPGDLVIHGAFSAHCNEIGASRAVVLNLDIDARFVDFYGRVSDADAVVRLAERAHHEAASLALAMVERLAPVQGDWPDRLAADLAADPMLSIQAWAWQQGLAVETVSRGFTRAFGATPKRVRFEHRTLRALDLLSGSSSPLADVALDAGFADQAGMTRAIRNLTGATPLAWRRGQSTGDKTDWG